MGRTELLFVGQRLFTRTEELFFLCVSHVPKQDGGLLKEFIVVKECHVKKTAVSLEDDKIVKAFSMTDKSVLCPAKKDLAYTIQTQKNFGRRMFVVGDQPFYISTGVSSNDTSQTFQHIAFPFKGVNAFGWFVKCCVSIDATWMKALFLMPFLQHSDKKMQNFLSRFETYDQLRVSALTKDRCDTFWDENRSLLKFVRSHEWSESVRHFIRVPVPIMKKPERKPSVGISMATRFDGRISEVNKWLTEQGGKLI